MADSNLAGMGLAAWILTEALIEQLRREGVLTGEAVAEMKQAALKIGGSLRAAETDPVEQEAIAGALRMLELSRATNPDPSPRH